MAINQQPPHPSPEADTPRDDTTQSEKKSVPYPVLVIETSYLLLLLLGILVYAKSNTLRSLLPDPIGFVPLSVPWWGALGGVMIALYGIFFHNQKWDHSYDYWYYLRPITGAVLGAVAYLIFVVVIDATGAKAKTSGTLVYDLVAFLVGFSEQNFQDLIKRATQALFGTTPPRGAADHSHQAPEVAAPDQGKGQNSS